VLSLPEEEQERIRRAYFIQTHHRDWHRTPLLVSGVGFLLERGVAAFILMVSGLITGATIALVWLTVTILALWTIATVRHLRAGEAKMVGRRSKRG
jgi:hypothetical protein